MLVFSNITENHAFVLLLMSTKGEESKSKSKRP